MKHVMVIVGKGQGSTEAAGRIGESWEVIKLLEAIERSCARTFTLLLRRSRSLVIILDGLPQLYEFVELNEIKCQLKEFGTILPGDCSFVRDIVNHQDSLGIPGNRDHDLSSWWLGAKFMEW